MTTVTVTNAKAHLSQILADIELSGKEVVIRRGKKPIAQIVPLNTAAPKKRRLGTCTKTIWIAENFDAEDQEVNALFSGTA